MTPYGDHRHALFCRDEVRRAASFGRASQVGERSSDGAGVRMPHGERTARRSLGLRPASKVTASITDAGAIEI